MNKKINLVYGVGINDLPYTKRTMEDLPKVDGKRKRRLVWVCPYYQKWMSMLRRCYGNKEQILNSTYEECTVCPEWLTFSNFREWMVTQEWESLVGEPSLQLDKDLLVKGNKVYSPEACVFLHGKINVFITGGLEGRGTSLIGCYYNKKSGKYHAQINNAMIGNITTFIGLFNTEEEAHLAWKKEKHKYACKLAESKYVTDIRVEAALRTLYSNYNQVES